jgi:polyphosphate kinase 2 (PPK2 family)
MTTLPPLDHDELVRRISLDVADGYDEELEMEIEDRHPLPGVSPGPESAAGKSYRQDYFRQLFRLQAELVKLQDWVVASGEKVLIRRQGRHDQAHHSKAQSARGSSRGAAGPQ